MPFGSKPGPLRELQIQIYALWLQTRTIERTHLYNRSIQHLDMAVSLSGDKEELKLVWRRGAAVKCHKKLEMALEAQHTRLQHTLDELKTYQDHLIQH